MSLPSFICSVADLLRGDYKQSEYGKVILPFTVLRRMDCVLEGTKQAVLVENVARKKTGINPEPFLLRKAKQSFFNPYPMDMKTLMGGQDQIKENPYSYIQAFSASDRDIFQRFEFYTQIDRLTKSGLMYQVLRRLHIFASVLAFAAVAFPTYPTAQTAPAVGLQYAPLSTPCLAVDTRLSGGPRCANLAFHPFTVT
jgi:hypothetical protein